LAPAINGHFMFRMLPRSATRHQFSPGSISIGDGATVTRPIIRRRNQVRIGHTPIRIQLDWCRANGVRRAVFTHCGSQIVGGDERVLGAVVRRLGRERGVEAWIAYDGMKVTFDKPRAIGSKTTL
jgi:hypothetical protein